MKEKEALQRWLQEWIYDYVDGDPVNSSEGDQVSQAACRRARRGVPRTRKTPAITRRRFYLRPAITSSKAWNIGLRPGCRALPAPRDDLVPPI